MFVTGASRSGPGRLIDPGFAAAIEKLDLLSRKTFAGKLPGERRSKARGQSVEFDDYRDYVRGDDLRFLDWNVYARFDRLVLKLFREDRDLSAHLIVDLSASMLAADASQDGPARDPKLFLAAKLAAALGYTALVQNNRVVLTTFGGPGGLRTLAPLRGRRSTERLVRTLESASAAACEKPVQTDPDRELLAATGVLRQTSAQRGIVVLISDLLAPGATEAAIRRLASVGAGFDVWVIQVLTPDELDPSPAAMRSLAGDLALTDVERSRIVDVSMSRALAGRYRERMTTHLEAIRVACQRHGIHRVMVTTETPIDRLLFGTLRRQGLVGA